MFIFLFFSLPKKAFVCFLKCVVFQYFVCRVFQFNFICPRPAFLLQKYGLFWWQRTVRVEYSQMDTRKFHWICFGCCKSAAVTSEKLLILKYGVKHLCWACQQHNINIVDWVAVCIHPWKSPRIHYNEHKSSLFSWYCIDYINRMYIVYYRICVGIRGGHWL